MKKVFLAAVILCATSMVAQANTITLSPVLGNLFQQQVQNPCIFSNPACQNGNFPTTDVPNGGNVSTYDLLSPIYTGSQLLAITNGAPIQIGIDINQATGQGPQTLTAFYMLKNGVVVDTFTGSTGNVPATNNGNGFADYLLTNFSSISAGDQIQFHFVFNNANAGAENVFLIAGTPQNVPEPSALIALGVGVVFLGAALRKFRLHP